MKLALIPPIDLLEYTAETSLQLMLPHLVKNDVYRYTYQKLCEDREQYVILDNGEAEGESFDNETLINMALSYGVDELVIPDTIQDKAETIEKAKLFLDEFETFKFHHQDWPLNLMFVIQGKTYNEFFDCAVWAATQPQIDIIGVPRHMIETTGIYSARYELVHELKELTSKKIHLLGASVADPMEMCNTWPDNVRSTDTSSPFNYAYAGKQLDDPASPACKRPAGYFDMPWENFDVETVNHNVKRLMEWTGNDL